MSAFAAEEGLTELVEPAGMPLVHRLKHAVAGRVKGKREYYERIVRNVDVRIKKMRRFVYYHIEDLGQVVDYWLLHNSVGMTVLAETLERLLQTDPRALAARPDFPRSIQEDVSPAANVKQAIMYASLGFVMKTRTASPEMPPRQALEYVYAAIMLGSRWGAVRESDLAAIRNRVYLAALCTLKLFNPTVWTIFATRDAAELHGVVPLDAPGWFVPLLMGIETGAAVSASDQLQQLHRIVTQREAELRSATQTAEQKTVEVRALQRALQERDAELLSIRKELDLVRQLQANAAKQAEDLAAVVRTCGEESIQQAAYLRQSASEHGDASAFVEAERMSAATANTLRRASQEIGELTSANRSASAALSNIESGITTELREHSAEAESQRAMSAGVASVQQHPPPLPPRDISAGAAGSGGGGLFGAAAHRVLARRAALAPSTTTITPRSDSGWSAAAIGAPLRPQRTHRSQRSPRRHRTKSRSPAFRGLAQHAMTRENVMRDFGDIMA